MKFFDNVEEKIAEIRKNEFYKPHIDGWKYLYEQDKENPILPLDYKTFMTFTETGSRVESEKPYFHKRRRLGYLMMLALLYPEEEKYICDLCETVWSICSEVTWVVAAHLHAHFEFSKRQIDLFCAETSLYLAELVYFLGDRLPAQICDLIKSEIKIRIFDTMDCTTNWWETLNSNWAAVCGGSVGMTYMYLAPEKFSGDIKSRIMKTMNNYLDGIGDDGCCSEGIDYWYYGFSFYIHFAEMLYRFTDGKEDIRHLEKVEKLVEFQQNMIMRNSTVVSFSDGKMENRFIHTGLFNYLKQNYKNFKVPNMDMYNGEDAKNMFGGNHSTTRAKPSWVIREMLWSDPELKSDDFPKSDYKYYDKTQWYINKKEKYSFAAKAGHNQEEHNHNDVGAFIIATDKGQIISDLGAMAYTKKYFDPVERYNVFNASSLGHSVPIIDGQGQLFGKNHCAENVTANENVFAMDIDGAYDALGVKATRRFDIKENSVVLTDEYKCDNFENHKITERFISVIKPELLQDGVKIGDVFVKTSNAVNIGKVVENNHQLKQMNIYTIDIDVTEPVFSIEFEV